MYEVKVGNGNSNVFYITEEEKMRVLRNRLETERKANQKSKAFVTMLKETALQKCIAIFLAVGAAMAAMYLQDNGILIVPVLLSLVLFFSKRNIFEKVEVEEWDEL